MAIVIESTLMGSGILDFLEYKDSKYVIINPGEDINLEMIRRYSNGVKVTNVNNVEFIGYVNNLGVITFSDPFIEDEIKLTVNTGLVEETIFDKKSFNLKLIAVTHQTEIQEIDFEICQRIDQDIFTYTEADNIIFVSGLVGSKKTIVIPSLIEISGNIKVISGILSNTFRNKGLDEIFVPHTVKTIGKHAFVGNTGAEIIIDNPSKVKIEVDEEQQDRDVIIYVHDKNMYNLEILAGYDIRNISERI